MKEAAAKRTIFFRTDFPFGGKIRLEQDETNHLRSLRIFQLHKTVEFRDGKGSFYLYDIPQKSLEGTLSIADKTTSTEPNLVIASAIPKGNRLDWLLQKGTETGVSEFIFINFKRSVRKDFNLSRNEKIIKEAAAQCDRMFLPRIRIFSSLQKYWEEFSSQSILLRPDAKQQASVAQLKNLIPVIGPEGGFDTSELALMANCPATSFGNTVMRIETAGLYVASVKNFLSFFQIEQEKSG